MTSLFLLFAFYILIYPCGCLNFALYSLHFDFPDAFHPPPSPIHTPKKQILFSPIIPEKTKIKKQTSKQPNPREPG